MKTIHQYQLEREKQISSIALREGFRVVRCEYVIARKRVCLWVEEPLKIDVPLTRHQFVVVGSGVPVPVSYRHVDTALDPFGPEAFHVYEAIQAVDELAETTHRPLQPMSLNQLRLQA